MFKYPAKCGGNFCPTVDNRVTSVGYQPPFCFLSVILYLSLYLHVFILSSYRNVTKPHHRWRRKVSSLSACKSCHMYGNELDMRCCLLIK
jgi:uncharacterized protein YcbK (DUF882 family)